MQKYLEESEIIDFSHPAVSALAQRLAGNASTDVEIAKVCFEFVRDEIRHTGDHPEPITTLKASEVLKHKTGWCYAKSHLLAALLRANGIPASFCYQRLSCSEYKDDIFCLHGLNAVYLQEHGWYRIDPRGNKAGVDAQFVPPKEQLAFVLAENEWDLPENYAEPLDVVVTALATHKRHEEMVENIPDIVM
jgi:transglutaminase-like putative cysteine protease